MASPEELKDWFPGRCVSCRHARPCPRKGEMICDNRKAHDRGCGSRPGGAWNGDDVAKLFGCVYHEAMEARHGAG